MPTLDAPISSISLPPPIPSPRASHRPTPTLPLPLDIFHLIFDILSSQGDITAIKSCTLLSRTVLPSARKYLFSVIKLTFNPSSTGTIHHISRRIAGLLNVTRGSDLGTYIKTLHIIDTHPVSETDQWLTRIPKLPDFLTMLTSVRWVTFGCDVGMLDWGTLSAELKVALFRIFGSSTIEAVRFCQIRNVPHEDMISASRRAKKLALDRVHVLPQSELTSKKAKTRLFEIRVKTGRREDTVCAWDVILHTPNAWRRIVWRCWEDPQNPQVSLPGPIDLSLLPHLNHLVFKLSFGKYARDLNGCVSVLKTAVTVNLIKNISISISFPYPHQASPIGREDILNAPVWRDLQRVLLGTKFASLERITLEFTIHCHDGNVIRRRGDRMVRAREFRNSISQKMPELARTSKFLVVFKVNTFN